MNTELIYKGNKIEQITDAFGQICYVINGNRKTAFWSLSDAKKHINGKPTTYEPFDATNF